MVQPSPGPSIITPAVATAQAPVQAIAPAQAPPEPLFCAAADPGKRPLDRDHERALSTIEENVEQAGFDPEIAECVEQAGFNPESEDLEESDLDLLFQDPSSLIIDTVPLSHAVSASSNSSSSELSATLRHQSIQAEGLLHQSLERNLSRDPSIEPRLHILQKFPDQSSLLDFLKTRRGAIRNWYRQQSVVQKDQEVEEIPVFVMPPHWHRWEHPRPIGHILEGPNTSSVPRSLPAPDVLSSSTAASITDEARSAPLSFEEEASSGAASIAEEASAAYLDHLCDCVPTSLSFLYFIGRVFFK